MLEKHAFQQPDPTDLGLFSYGFEDCRPGHRWGPGVRDHNLIHLILSGRGSFQSKRGEFSLRQGEGFFISPGDVVEYQADRNEPWSYLWIGFYGLQAGKFLASAGLSRQQPILTQRQTTVYQDIIRAMLGLSDEPKADRVRLVGYLYFFMAQLIEDAKRPQALCQETQQAVYVRQAVQLMASRYAGPLTIQEIADHVGLNRSYLYALFRKHLRMTPKDYLTELRLRRAEDLLKTSLSIAKIARSVGYDDPLLFSKIFKKSRGLPPSRYRLH